MNAWLNYKVHEIFDLNKKYSHTDRYGVEVEFEGKGILNNSNLVGANPSWKVVADGSLRGESFEAVMRAPLGYSDTIKAVKELYNLVTSNKAVINDSMRAGTHVHVNCLNLTVQQLMTFMAAYYCLEDILVDYLGDERAGNFFCLRVSDAEEISHAIASALANNRLRNNNIFTNENLRYSAMNLVSLSKFGSLEFRALKTPTTVEPILEWLEILEKLFTGSFKFNSPLALVSAMSANGEKEVLSKLLPEEFANKVFKRPDFEDKLYSAIRNIQFWVFKTKWNEK